MTIIVYSDGLFLKILDTSEGAVNFWRYVKTVKYDWKHRQKASRNPSTFISFMYEMHYKFWLFWYQEALDGYKKCVMAQNDPEAVKTRAMQDPEVQKILTDPAMQLILQQMQKDPKALQE